MHRAGKLFVQPASGSYDSLSKILLDKFEVPHQFLPGWGVRLKRGSMYGAKYIGPFRSEVEELFNRKEVSSAEKIGPGGMLEVLRLRHPLRFDLPSENEIRQEISKLKRKSTSDNSSRIGSKGNGQKARISSDQVAFLERLLSRNIDLAPRVVVAEFRVAYVDSELTDNQINYQVKKIKD